MNLLRMIWLNIYLWWVVKRFNGMLIDIYNQPTDEAMKWITQMRWYAAQKPEGFAIDACLEALDNLEYAVKRKAHHDPR